MIFFDRYKFLIGIIIFYFIRFILIFVKKFYFSEKIFLKKIKDLDFCVYFLLNLLKKERQKSIKDVIV